MTQGRKEEKFGGEKTRKEGEERANEQSTMCVCVCESNLVVATCQLEQQLYSKREREGKREGEREQKCVSRLRGWPFPLSLSFVFSLYIHRETLRYLPIYLPTLLRHTHTYT